MLQNSEPISTSAMSAEAIQALRHTMHLSQEDFAALLNVSPPTVMRWEKSQRPPARKNLHLLQVLSALIEEASPEWRRAFNQLVSSRLGVLRAADFLRGYYFLAQINEDYLYAFKSVARELDNAADYEMGNRSQFGS